MVILYQYLLLKRLLIYICWLCKVGNVELNCVLYTKFKVETLLLVFKKIIIYDNYDIAYI